MKKLQLMWKQLLIIVVSFWTFVLCAVAANLPINEIILYYTMIGIITVGWVDYVKYEYKLFAFGICTFICIVLSMFVFEPAFYVLVALMSASSQLVYLFGVKFGEQS